MKIGKTRHSKIYVVLGKTKIEDSRGFRRRYSGRNSVPKFQDILHWRIHINGWRKLAIHHWIYTETPGRFEKVPRCIRVARKVPYAFQKCQAHGKCARRMMTCEKSHFCDFFTPKKHILLAQFRWKLFL